MKPEPLRRVWLDYLIVIGAALFCGFVTYFPLTDSDIWWHLASGREMIRRGALLFADPFSFTPHDERWINAHWLFQIGAYLLHGVAGVKGLLIAKGVVTALAVAIVVIAAPGRQARVWTAALICPLIFETRYLVLERPTVFTLLFIAVDIWCWERFWTTGKRRYLGLMIPVQILWTNVQGLFVLGPVIALAYLVGEGAMQFLRQRSAVSGQRQSPASALVAAGIGFAALIAATFVNPNTWRGVLFPLRLFDRIDPSASNVFSANISENAPLTMLLRSEPRYVAVVVITAIVGILCLALNGKRARTSHVLLFAACMFLAYCAERNILLFCFVAPMVIGANLAALPQVAGLMRRRITQVAAGLTIVMVLAAYATTHARILAICPRHEEISPFRFPDLAVAYLKDHPVPGHIFNADRYGGYLLWHLYPPKQVFIDGRFVLRSAGFFSDYLKVLDVPTLFPFAVEYFNITHVLLQTAIFPRYTPLARELYADSAWVLVCADGASALFVRRDLATTPRLRLDAPEVVGRIEESLKVRWRDDPVIRQEALGHLAAFVAAVVRGERRTL